MEIIDTQFFGFTSNHYQVAMISMSSPPVIEILPHMLAEYRQQEEIKKKLVRLAKEKARSNKRVNSRRAWNNYDAEIVLGQHRPYILPNSPKARRYLSDDLYECLEDLNPVEKHKYIFPGSYSHSSFSVSTQNKVLS
jgi:hypothetical protein